jgi:flagellar basal-body rod protein FlgB
MIKKKRYYIIDTSLSHCYYLTMNFDGGFNILKEGLSASSLQHSLIGQNIANISTPGYKRKEVNFHQTLLNNINQSFPVKKTHIKHLPLSFNSEQINAFVVRDRVSPTNSLENNVDLDTEMVNLATNNAYYNAISTFIGNKFNTLTNVISERII